MKHIKKVSLIACFLYGEIFGAPIELFTEKIIKAARQPQIVFTGYIKLDNFLDSRQIVAEREGETLFYPRAAFFDSRCCDINKHGRFQMSAIETRLAAIITGKPVGDARTRAYIEGDFYGPTDETISAFRMRHAFFTLTWDKTELLFGQFWHPLFVLDCYPLTVSYNTGIPIDTFARNPQVRLTQQFPGGELIIAAVTQWRKFCNTGINGFTGEYARNAIMPMFDAQLRLFYKEHVFGAGFDYKRIVPRLFGRVDRGEDNESECERLFKVRESLNSVSVIAYAILNLPRWSILSKAIYAQNGTDEAQLGGYAVATRSTKTGCQTYANMPTAGAWVDISRTNTKIRPGIFIGGTKNLGADSRLFVDTELDIVRPIIYSNAPTIDYVFRMSPRVWCEADPLLIGAEVEWTRAAYGCLNTCPEAVCTDCGPLGYIDCRGRVVPGKPVDNIRLIVAAYYLF